MSQRTQINILSQFRCIPRLSQVRRCNQSKRPRDFLLGYKDCVMSGYISTRAAGSGGVLEIFGNYSESQFHPKPWRSQWKYYQASGPASPRIHADLSQKSRLCPSLILVLIRSHPRVTGPELFAAEFPEQSEFCKPRVDSNNNIRWVK